MNNKLLKYKQRWITNCWNIRRENKLKAGRTQKIERYSSDIKFVWQSRKKGYIAIKIIERSDKW